LLVDTFFTTPERGWVVGGKSNSPNPNRNNVKPVVLFTEDGGQTWVNRIANLQNELPFGEWGWKIQFLNDSVGFVSLENMKAGAILKTTDGGLTWQRNAVNDPQGNANLEGVGFADENRGWVGGGAMRISRADSAVKPPTAAQAGRTPIKSVVLSIVSGFSGIRLSSVTPPVKPFINILPRSRLRLFC
jgi:hypothetical protein